ncbi:DUF1127 domain-containing protein [Roseicyclus persicicus]|uniref:DUF1127 domain-containing protein n=1 Tax=Roseicyclus persicicus TaxID=2650661 RepID=A0A7X6GY98_9RHOB|nr:DUF1127 domain-containing protein [Roseibacterium persicicum]NKX44630.1 DUF1127 domain-containing protein [Roseibacterium persicicum]
MTDETLHRTFPTLDFSELPRKGTRHILALLRRARHVRDYRHLDGLPDYLLSDVGFTRAEVRRLAGRTRESTPPLQPGLS